MVKGCPTRQPFVVYLRGCIPNFKSLFFIVVSLNIYINEIKNEYILPLKRIIRSLHKHKILIASFFVIIRLVINKR